MPTCLIALGSNLGDRAATLDAAIAALAASSDAKIVARSAWHLTFAIGGGDSQPEFLNGAAVLETFRAPADLLELLQQIETQFGRTRHARWADRTLDLDLLLYGNQIIDTPGLTIPHPRMTFRRFVLEPAVEIAGDWVHPSIGQTLAELVDQLENGAECVAIVSRHDSPAAELCETLTQRFNLEIGRASVDEPRLWPTPSTRWLWASEPGNSTRPPKLTILLGGETELERGHGPTLRIPTATVADDQQDAFAAIAAVWPRLGRVDRKRLQ